MEFWTIVICVVVGIICYRRGHRSGERNGVSRVQDAIVKGAAGGLSDAQQNELAERIRELNAQTPKSGMTIEHFARRAFNLGDLLATANHSAGEMLQDRASQPTRGRVRVDLTLPQLRSIDRMASYGFNRMIRAETRDPWRFQTRDEAHEAASSIDALSRLIGLETSGDETDRLMRIDASGDRQFLIAAAFADTRPQ